MPKILRLWQTIFMGKNLHQWLKFIGGTKLFSAVLLWLILLLVAGTVAQQSMGLFAAQNLFFFSWILWLPTPLIPIPFPSSMTALTLITVGLIVKMFYLQTWKKRKIGTITAHLATLGLLLGGLFVASISTHGNMIVKEGSRSNIKSNPYTTELAITDAATNQTLYTFPQSALTPNATFNLPTLNHRITIENFMANTAIQRREEPFVAQNTRGMLINIALLPQPESPKEEDNFAGLIFNLTGQEEKRLGIFEQMPIAQTLEHEDKTYHITLRRTQSELPFSIELIRFIREVYPGTDTPRGFSSDVILHSPDGAKWPARIAMNAPLRYKGWTIYQASFVDAGNINGQKASIFAVVKNQGRLIPYITSLILCLGLLIHLFIRLPILWGKKS